MGTVQHFLEKLPLFQDLTADQIEQAHQVLHLKRVKAGVTLMLEDQPGDLVYIVAEGSLKICGRFGDNETLIALRGPGEVVGEMSVLDGMNRSANVVVQEESLLFWIGRTDFWSILWEMPPLSYNLMRLLTQRVRVMTAQVQAMSSLDMQGRLARQLILLAEEYGQPISVGEVSGTLIPFRLKQIELAAMIGASREQVNKLLASWLRRGFIQRDGQRLIVVRRQSLQRFYEETSVAMK